VVLQLIVGKTGLRIGKTRLQVFDGRGVGRRHGHGLAQQFGGGGHLRLLVVVAECEQQLAFFYRIAFFYQRPLQEAVGGSDYLVFVFRDEGARSIHGIGELPHLGLRLLLCLPAGSE